MTREGLIEVIDLFLGRQYDGDEFEHRDNAIALVAAIEAAGVRLVPVEATEEQLDAALTAPHPDGKRTVGSVLAAEYKAAVAASPYAPAQKDESHE